MDSKEAGKKTKKKASKQARKKERKEQIVSLRAGKTKKTKKEKRTETKINVFADVDQEGISTEEILQDRHRFIAVLLLLIRHFLLEFGST